MMLSKRAKKALEMLNAGASFACRLERNQNESLRKRRIPIVRRWEACAGLRARVNSHR